MELDGLGGASVGATNTDNPRNDELGRDEFLLLLTTQLANQNPLEPQEGAEFVAQLAHFSSVEQLTQLSSSMEDLARAQTFMLQGQALDVVGHLGVFEGNFVDVPEDGNLPISYELSEPASQVRIEVLDANDNVVAAVAGAPTTGLHTVTFNGLDVDGNRLPAGRYRLRVNATAADGTRVPAKAFATARLDGVTYENGAAELTSGDQLIKPADIIRVLD